MMNSIRLCVFFLVALLTLAPIMPIVQANCTNSAVYSLCKQRGSSFSALCTSTDYICLCDAVKAISECYSQCTDDANTVAEASAYSQVVAGSCSLAASQSLTMTTPTPAKSTSTSSKSPVPSLTSSMPSATDTGATASSTPNKSDASVIAIYINKNIILLLTAPLIAIVIMLL
ncbi:hypothetical protein Glove_327g33 [Diversispora epigaea]|uniref:Extracellular membrane protein CFEM domain-containing protein n=1 Tax=Diversispora epigaea TaxID=1348612 RepID=A0A397HTF6_9GLOM|nr:hypothetical protein Glove_327g33 [Diversispora epigaea]